MKDFLGKDVDIGDYVFYSTTGRYPAARFGKITRMSDKSIWINILKENRRNLNSKDEVIIRTDFVKVENIS